MRLCPHDAGACWAFGLMRARRFAPWASLATALLFAFAPFGVRGDGLVRAAPRGGELLRCGTGSNFFFDNVAKSGMDARGVGLSQTDSVSGASLRDTAAQWGICRPSCILLPSQTLQHYRFFNGWLNVVNFSDVHPVISQRGKRRFDL